MKFTFNEYFRKINKRKALKEAKENDAMRQGIHFQAKVPLWKKTNGKLYC